MSQVAAAAPKLHKKRMANIELLRLLAMMMVVSLHFLAKGELLAPLAAPMNAQGYLSWFLECFSIVAVDVYVIISGYFLVETGFRCRRIIQLVLQVMFYTILIPICLMALGIMTPSELTFYKILQYVFPTNMLHYWFVSAYVLMFLFTPILNAAVHSMKKQQLKYTIFVLLIMESLSKTVIPVRLELDNLGYDALWFMVVYLIAAYIRLYGIRFFSSCRKSAVSYVGLIGAIYIVLLGVRFLFLQTGQFENFIEAPMGYNHLLTITAAVALFYTFYHMKFEGKMADLICKISPYTFGVYLLHEQVEVRYEWPFWLGAGDCSSPVSLLLHWIIALLAVMCAGLLIDAMRGLIFRAAGKIFTGGKIEKYLSYVDDKINGKQETL